LRAYEVADRFWDAKPCRHGGGRDVVAVEGTFVLYRLWGHDIARWDKPADTLDVDDCGYQSWLTKDRLNNILCQADLNVYSARNQWYLHSRRVDESYFWEGTHSINLKTGEVKPAKPRLRNPKISEGLKKFHEKAQRIMESKRRILVTPTLDGTVYVAVGDVYGRHRTRTLAVKVHSPEFEAWEGWLEAPTIYSAFVRADAGRLLGKLDGRLNKIEHDKAKHILSSLRLMDLEIENLPKELASTLAVARLLED